LISAGISPAFGSAALSVVTEGELLEKDAVAEKAEACSSVHLSFDQFPHCRQPAASWPPYE
jgi:hypothetical protein